MAKITLNGVDALTESGGVVTIPGAANLTLGTGAVPTAAIQDNAVTTTKIATGTTEADSFNLPGQHAKIPSITTTQRDALTAAVGMLVYNSTLGMLQQYNAAGWTSIDAPPTISSFTYPDSQTALNPLGSTTQTLVITGTNFSVGATVLIDGTAPTSTTRNSSTQITITGYPAKAAATYSAGFKVTNASGLAASIDIAYDAIPAWTTAAGSLGSFVDGAYTNSSTSTIRIVAAEASDTIDYAQVSDAGGATVITSGVAGLTLGTTGANAGYLTGTLAGSEGTTYTFYAKAQDDENQFSAVRSFNIISSYAATGGTIIEPAAYTGDFRSHTFLADGSFVVLTTVLIDYLIIGGGGGSGTYGGGGAGGFRTATSLSLSAGTYAIVVGDGGGEYTATSGTASKGTNGGTSSLIGGSISISVTGGGGGGSSHVGNRTGNATTDGSGGGGGSDGAGPGGAAGTYGTAGGASYTSHPTYAGGGGGGAGGAGGVGQSSGATGGAGGAGLANYYRDGNTSGTTIGTHIFAGGGGGLGYYYPSGADNGGAGGSGGGGTGGNYQSGGATGGATNTGSGGGQGVSGGAGIGEGTDGGSGVVIIRYAV